MRRVSLRESLRASLKGKQITIQDKKQKKRGINRKKTD